MLSPHILHLVQIHRPSHTYPTASPDQWGRGGLSTRFLSIADGIFLLTSILREADTRCHGNKNVLWINEALNYQQLGALRVRYRSMAQWLICSTCPPSTRDPEPSGGVVLFQYLGKKCMFLHATRNEFFGRINTYRVKRVLWANQ